MGVTVAQVLVYFIVEIIASTLIAFIVCFGLSGAVFSGSIAFQLFFYIYIALMLSRLTLVIILGSFRNR